MALTRFLITPTIQGMSEEADADPHTSAFNKVFLPFRAQEAEERKPGICRNRKRMERGTCILYGGMMVLTFQVLAGVFALNPGIGSTF